MGLIARRHCLMLLAAAGAASVGGTAAALTPAKTWRDVWPEVAAGDFGAAAERLALHVAEWPLDHEARTDLAIMQFADGAFEAAALNLEREVRLRKGYAKDQPSSADFDKVECWYYLANVRAGKGIDIPPAQYRPSLLSLLSGQITLDQFIEQGLAAQDAAYAQAEQVMQMVAQIVAQQAGQKAASAFTYQKPDRQMIIAALTCPARLMLAEQAIAQNDGVAARTHLTSAIASKAEGAVEYHIAKAELERLG